MVERPDDAFTEKRERDGPKNERIKRGRAREDPPGDSKAAGGGPAEKISHSSLMHYWTKVGFPLTGRRRQSYWCIRAGPKMTVVIVAQ